MADKRPPNPKFTTPRGVFKFPRLDKPDYGNDQYPCAEGQFKTSLILQSDDPATQALIAKLRPLHDDAVRLGNEGFAALKPESRKKLKQLSVNEFFTEVLDKVTEEPTGALEFKFKIKYATPIKNGKNAGKTWYRFPALFDAKGVPLNKYHADTGKVLIQCPPIWGGSEGKLTFEVSPYFIGGTGTAGLSLTLLAGQIIKRVEGGERSASEYGFGEEDGYSAGDNDTSGDDGDIPPDDSAEAGGGAGDDDF
jgi:hypothetical protein